MVGVLFSLLMVLFGGFRFSGGGGFLGHGGGGC